MRNTPGPYGEINILEGFNDITQNYMTLHTSGACSFNPPANTQTGTSNNGNTNCQLSNVVGCSVQGPASSYGTPFNENGGGVYAMWWTSDFIRIYIFPRSAIPADIISGRLHPSTWGLPVANFDSKYGKCSIDSNFPPQTIVSFSSYFSPHIHTFNTHVRDHNLTHHAKIVFRHDILRRQCRWQCLDKLH